MADAPIAPTAPTSQSPTPPAAPGGTPPAAAPDPASEGPTIAKAMEAFDKAVTPKAPDKAAPKPGEPPVDPKAKPATPPAKSKDDDEKVDWEKAPPKLKNQFFKSQREAQEKIAAAEKRIKEIEAKSKEAPGDAKMIEAYQKQINDLNAKLAESSFERSEEFQKQYVQRWKGEYDAAVAEVVHLRVTVGENAAGEVQTRAATEADFQRILRLPPGDQDEAIQKMFGHYAPRVFSRLMELQRIERASQQAVKDHASTVETRTKESEAKTIRERQEYDQAVERSNAELAEKWPHYFAPDENDPEASEALNAGYEFVDNALKTSSTLPPAERAAYNSVIRARAAAFQRVAFDNNRLSAKIKELEEELGKYRQSDPGGNTRVPSGGTPPAPEPGHEAIGGIQEAAKAFDK